MLLSSDRRKPEIFVAVTGLAAKLVQSQDPFTQGHSVRTVVADGRLISNNP
jgi:hypothetical protein